jgi:competence protein ComEA
MDRVAEWRPIEPSGPGGSAAEPSAATPRPVGHWRALVVGVLGCLAIGAVAVALWAGSPQPQLVLGAADPSLALPGAVESPAASPLAAIVVDVEGAVVAPGIYTLPGGGRVGDAITAAGGYSPQVDIEVAAQVLNLAARLADGEKVLVPRLGAEPVLTPAPSVAAGGLVDVNRADQPALETLPGIGPATAAKIIAARTEAPFASIDELLTRGVVGPATFDKIKPLITVGP